MRILLTGSEGYIGTPLHQRLIKQNHNVICLDIKINQSHNLLHFDKWPKDIDLVIHLAGKSGVRESIKDPTSYWFNNVEASKRLFEAYQTTRIIYASSSSAYEPDLNPYAASKYILEEVAAKHSNSLGLRLHTVYNNNPRKNMFVYRLLNGELEYTTDHYRDFIHLNDVIDSFDMLIEKNYLKGIIDVGTGIPTKISKIAPDLPIRINTPGERQFTCANTEKLFSLGFRPKYSIENLLTKNKSDNIINLITEKN